MPRRVLSATLAAIAFASAQPAVAALSGYYDSAEKITAILADGRIADLLRQAPLRAIRQTGTAPDGSEEWTLRTRDCSLRVMVIPQPPKAGMVGRTTYAVQPAPACN